MGIAWIVLVWSLATPLVVCAFWLVLALVGQAVSLQLIDAGPTLHYQHYLPMSSLRAEDSSVLLLGALAIQSIIVLLGLYRMRQSIVDWCRQNFSYWQLVVLGVLVFLPSATLSRDFPTYLGELIFASCIQAVNLGNMVLMFRAIPESVPHHLQRKLGGAIAWYGDESTPRPRCVVPFVVAAAVAVFMLSAFLSLTVYDRHPHLQDEVAYVMHAESLSCGNLKNPAPPVAEAFISYLIYQKGQECFAVTPPGWPAVLAAGVFVGAAWLVNPLLAAVNVTLMYIVLRGLYNEQIGRLGAILLLLSPWHLFLAMSFMPHIVTLTCALASLAALLHACNSGRSWWGWIAGAFVGFASLARPLDGLIVASIVGCAALFYLRGAKLLPVGGGLVAATAIIGGLVLPYNYSLTGDALLFPIMAYTDEHFGPKANAYGFGPERGLGWPLDPNPGHGPIDALINSNLNVSSLNTELFGWSTGSLFLACLLIVRTSFTKADVLMLISSAAVFTAYFFNYFSGGPDFAARYWFLIILPMVALTCRGIDAVGETVARSAKTSQRLNMRAPIVVLLLCLMSLVNFVPWRAYDKYHNYLNMRADIRRLNNSHKFGNGLVLIRGKRFPDYASAAVYNPSNIRASDAAVYAWYGDEQMRARLERAFPSRRVWVVDGPSVTGSGFRLAQRPTHSIGHHD